jgi:hypothetical protein
VDAAGAWLEQFLKGEAPVTISWHGGKPALGKE